MKKSIIVHGKNRGEITVAPQVNLAYNIDVVTSEGRIVLANKELHELKSYSVSSRVGDSAVITIHHVATKQVEAVVEWVEEQTLQFIQEFDDKKSVEARLHESGFTL